MGDVLRQQLPGIPWAFASDCPPGDRDHVEAMLLGSVERELGDTDLRSFSRLRFVQRVYTGMDGVPFERFPPGVQFAGNVGAFAPFVSEHAVAIALAAARDLPHAIEEVRAGTLRPPPAQRLLWQRTAVVLGYGEIGRAIAARLAGFEMRILGLNRTGRMAPGCSAMFPSTRLVQAAGEGDLVFDARPLTRSTQGTIDETVLSAMKEDAIFVNIGRAGTVREQDLFRHLLDHPKFRAALDVWWHEDFAAGRLLHEFPFELLPNVVGTPHSAGFGPGVEEHVLRCALDNLARYFSGLGPRHVVDPSEYDRAPRPA